MNATSNWLARTLGLWALMISTNINAQYNFPGGLVEILIEKQSLQLPEVRFGTREPIVIEQDKHWRILVGLSLATLPGEYLVYIKSASKDSRAFSQTFNVEQKSYSLLSDNREKEQIYTEYSSLSDLDFSNTEQPSLPLRYPIEGEWVEQFGQVLNTNSDEVVQQNLISKRVTQIGTVVAPQNAIVSRIETDKFDISSLYLDHGRGLYSIIRGVTDLSVKTGNGVVAGAVLGKSPYYKGRASFITWQCVMNGVYVNPVILAEFE